MRYKTLAELRYACERARNMNREIPVLTLDNDTTDAYLADEKVFSMAPDMVLEQALDLLGIPHEEA
jgi:hypothetical protein